jgi:hypothetical protein
MRKSRLARDIVSPMNPAAWLEKTAPGFDLLSGSERDAIKDFSLLWTLYEGTVLQSSGSAAAIIRAVGFSSPVAGFRWIRCVRRSHTSPQGISTGPT